MYNANIIENKSITHLHFRRLNVGVSPGLATGSDTDKDSDGNLRQLSWRTKLAVMGLIRMDTAQCQTQTALNKKSYDRLVGTHDNKT